MLSKGAYSHSIADGVSGMIFFRDLLAAYELIKKNQQPPAPTQVVIPGATVRRVPFQFSARLFAFFMWPLIMRQVLYVSDAQLCVTPFLPLFTSKWLLLISTRFFCSFYAYPT